MGYVDNLKGEKEGRKEGGRVRSGGEGENK